MGFRMRRGWVSIHTGLAWGAILGVPLWLAPPACLATVWEVKADGTGDVPTLQAAIEAAVSGDTVLVFPGTYTEHCTLDGKTLVFRGRDGAATTLLDGQLSGRVLMVNSGEVTLEGFTIENGRKNGIEVDNQGAGVAGFKAFVHIRDCIFQGNIASLGGAVYISSLSAPEGPSLLPSAQLGTGLLIENTVFLNNIATEVGGGLHADEVPSTLVDCTFQGNHAGQLGGGADFLHADQHLVRCRFEGNDAFNGAGVSWSGFGVLSLDQVVFQSTIADNQGGGLWSVNATQLVLDHTWFLENHADRGGGIYLAHVLASGARSLWRGNTGTSRGGDAYFLQVAGGEFDYSTWMSGTSPNGAAIFAEGGDLHLVSCIVGEESGSAVVCAAGTNASSSCTVGGLTTGGCLAFVARTTIAGCAATPELLCSIPAPPGCGAVGHAIAVCPEGCPTPVRNTSWGTLKARYRP
jgi:Chlamydia polymorphic membrane protein (Chlamydia_PMP) repeat